MSKGTASGVKSEDWSKGGSIVCNMESNNYHGLYSVNRL